MSWGGPPERESAGGEHASGSSPRLSATDFGVPTAVRCPFCEGDDTELHSAFGGQLSTATYWCRRCHTAFEWFKWEG